MNAGGIRRAGIAAIALAGVVVAGTTTSNAAAGQVGAVVASRCTSIDALTFLECRSTIDRLPAVEIAAGASANLPAERLAVDPSGESMPAGDLPGWRHALGDDFSTDVALGSFPTASAADWSAYPSPWKDTSRRGSYAPLKVVEVSNGVLSEHIRTQNGVPLVAAILPKIHDATTPGSGMLYGRFAVRFRTDPLPGYSMACLLWPDSEKWPNDGEIDFPEMGLASPTIGAYAHHQGATTGADKTVFVVPADLTAWHTAIIEWSPNLLVFRLDGVEIGRTTDRVPNTPMHWVLQTETLITALGPPDPAVAGNVQVDWLAAWHYDPSVT